MKDIKELLVLKENNRLEFKRCESILPRSVWETYSAFANTTGGIILLGVSELKNKSLSITGIVEPHKIIEDFWNLINNPTKVSANVLTEEDVKLLEDNGKYFILIEVRRAPNETRPVFINNDLLNGTYKRNYSGDYHCSRQELSAMFRDQLKVPDSRVLNDVRLEALSDETISAYRNACKYTQNGHFWEKYSVEKFLATIGAIAKGEDDKMHPTVAGLLFFGYEYEITRVFGDYFLDYQEIMTDNPKIRWTDRIYSTSGDWAGNLFEFHSRVYNKLQLDLPIPFEMLDGLHRKSHTDLHMAVREALTNCLANADFSFGRGLVVRKRPGEIIFENPGSFRISLESALEGGLSDPRNGTILKMFNIIDIGERLGSGIPSIVNAFREANLPDPVIKEQFGPDRTILSLKIRQERDELFYLDHIQLSKQERMIVDYIRENQFITRTRVEGILNIKQKRANTLLTNLMDRQIILKVGDNRSIRYVLVK